MKRTYTVNGMKCEHCKTHVENALNALNGVAQAVVSLSEHNVTVDFDDTQVTPAQMKDAIDAAGHYEMEL